MFCKLIVSENERTYIDVEAIVLGEDEKQVEHEAKERFRQLIKENDPDLDSDEIEDCVLNDHYFSDPDETGKKSESKELMIMTPRNIIQT